MASDAELLASLQETRSNILLAINVTTAAWIEAGCPPDFSIDGESYQWSNWLANQLAGVEKLNAMINGMNPYELPMTATG